MSILVIRTQRYQAMDHVALFPTTMQIWCARVPGAATEKHDQNGSQLGHLQTTRGDRGECQDGITKKTSLFEVVDNPVLPLEKSQSGKKIWNYRDYPKPVSGSCRVVGSKVL